MLESLYHSGCEIDWNEYHRDYSSAHRVLELPRYSWDLKRYWIDYRNDFCLLKGDKSDDASLSPTAPFKQLPNYKYISPAVQKVIEEKHGTEESKVIIESDVFDEKLLPVLQGHLVNGAALCPSSLYADVALTIAHYMTSEAGQAVESTGFNVSSMKVEAPLIALPSEKTHAFRVSAEANWRLNQIKMSLGSMNETGKITRRHATFVVLLTPQQTWLDDWKRLTHLVQSRVDSLVKGVVEGSCHHIKRGMAYKLFGALVDYGKEYQGMKDVVMDSDQLEAVSTVEFQVGAEGFHLNPRWIDSLGHIAGFIMNANDTLANKSTVFVNHGWDHMRISGSLEAGKTYRAYNRMQLVEKTLYAGDTYIFDSGRLIAVFEGVTFQGVPRQSLDHLLPGRPSGSAPILKINSQATNVSVKAAHPANGNLEPLMDKGASDERSRPVREAKPSHDIQAVSTGHAQSSPPPTAIMDRILAIIGEEVGITPSDLTADTEFSNVGIDSLLSLTMTSRIQEELDLDLPSSVFVENPTVGALQSLVVGEAANAPGTKPSVQPPPEGRLIEVDSSSSEDTQSDADSVTDSASSPTPPLSSIATTPGVPNKWTAALDSYTVAVSDNSHELVASPPHATSTLLSSSGTLARAKRLFFLFPDGSGSAASYASLASSIGGDIAVYGLNCPWRRDAEDMTRLGVDMDILARKFLAETQRIIRNLPCLPYSLGGWSAGGMIACEVARQIQAMRGTPQPERIVLIDSPNPIGLQNPPQRLYDFLDSIGTFGSSTGKMPAWLRQHFSAFIRVLDEYEPRPLPRAPPTLIIYARDGVCKNSDVPKIETHPADPREMRWLLNNRTDFTGDGWASLFGRDNLHVEIVDDVNHFSMMDPGSKNIEIGRLTARFLVGDTVAT
ncbi:putative secondary metabolism biosynthetic enzyme [Diaporthe australafricana]|uniref:Secondary metabolism biosynthetic enzyme n=1 Tax=Diaporthe australafricana TaxID=127596 RepID=A0ABR3WGQ0_9PEZI